MNNRNIANTGNGLRPQALPGRVESPVTIVQFLSVLILGALLVVTNVLAAGFAINENSAKQLGVAFAGGSAIADDGSTIWSNPAGMYRVGESLQVTGSYINPRFDFSNDGSVQNTPVGDLPLLPTSSEAGGGGTSAVVPAFFYIRPLSDRWFLGIGLNAPFGLTTEYEANWIGRYHAVKSEIVTINLNPSIAYRLNDHFSVGAGININYMDAELTNAVDFAAVCGSVVGTLCPNGSIPGQGEFDGFVKNTADDTSLGFNAGIMWSPSEVTRVGMAYRSEIEHSLSGAVDFSEPSSLGGFAALGPLGSALGATFADGANSSRVTLPDSASLSLFHQLSEKVALVGDLTWTDWADIPELRITFENALTPVGVESLNWQEAWRAAAGIILNLNDRWTVRGGYAYDESPVPSSADSTPRLPDNDRQWLAFGVSHRLGDALTVDVGYAHLFISDSTIARLESTGGVLNGTYSADADILSLQFNYTLE